MRGASVVKQIIHFGWIRLQIIKFILIFASPDRHVVTISHHGLNPLGSVKVDNQPLTVLFNNYLVDWIRTKKDRACSARSRPNSSPREDPGRDIYEKYRYKNSKSHRHAGMIPLGISALEQ